MGLLDRVQQVVAEVSGFAGGVQTVVRNVGSHLKQDFMEAGFTLQAQIARTITSLFDDAMKPLLHDCVSKFGQEGLDRAVREDRNLVGMMYKYRPSYLRYVHQARRIRSFVTWDDQRFAGELQAYLEDQGLHVDPAAYEWLVRTVRRFHDEIYG